MRVISVVTGIGFGDAIRENIILECLKKKVPNIKIRTVAYNHSYDFFKNKYPTFKMHGYTFTGYNLKFQLFNFILLNFFLPFFWLIDALRIKRQWKDFEPDFIISDFEPLGLVLAKLWNKPCFTIFAFDPKSVDKFEKNHELSIKQKIESKYLNFLCSRKVNLTTFVPTFFGGKQNYDKFIFVNPLIRESKIQKSEEELLKELNLSRKPILIMMGGSDFGLTLTNKILRYLEEFDENFIIFGYITNFSRENVKAFEFKEDFLPFLRISKGVITLAGHETLSEALKYKKPLLVFPIEDHIEQELNSDSIKNIALIGEVNDIRKSVKKFIKNMFILQKKVNSIEIKTDGAQQIIDNILKRIS